MKKPKYLKKNKLVEGNTYFRCHGHLFPIEPLIYKGYNPDAGFGLCYKFKSLTPEGRRDSLVSLGENELMLFDNLHDAINLVRYRSRVDFENKLEEMEMAYIDQQVGFSLKKINPTLLAKLLK